MAMFSEAEIFQRTSLLAGSTVCERISDVKVIIFGIGGVGSWCAEALVRAGVRNLSIVDCDVVNVSNVNRQLMATCSTVGRVKVEAMKERLLEINPHARINPICREFSKETSASFSLSEYHYIIDAIDTLKNKVQLILDSTATDATFFSSLGSALKVDPTRIRVSDFWKVRDCPLGAALRKRMRQSKTLPAHSFLCVHGDEVLPNLGLTDEAASEGKAVINGSFAHITAIFGMTLAGLVIEDIYKRVTNPA